MKWIPQKWKGLLKHCQQILNMVLMGTWTNGSIITRVMKLQLLPWYIYVHLSSVTIITIPSCWAMNG